MRIELTPLPRAVGAISFIGSGRNFVLLEADLDKPALLPASLYIGRSISWLDLQLGDCLAFFQAYHRQRPGLFLAVLAVPLAESALARPVVGDESTLFVGIVSSTPQGDIAFVRELGSAREFPFRRDEAPLRTGARVGFRLAPGEKFTNRLFAVGVHPIIDAERAVG